MSASRPVIVIPGDDPPQIAGSPHLERLRRHGGVVLHDTRPRDVEEQVERAREATAILNSRGQVKWPGEALRRLPDLEMITVCGIGTDSIDLEAARELGIVVCNVPGRTAPVVAEHALALLLGVARRVAFQTAELRAGRWTRALGTSLAGKTLGVIGTGNIGCAMIRLARAVGMNVIAWSYHPSPDKSTELGFRYTDLERLLEESDAVSLHVQLTEESRHLIGERELSRMKPGSLLVNTARGEVVDTRALVAALESGHLGGAGLDVFAEEPLPPDHPLLRAEQVVLTPHAADQTPEGVDLLNEGCADNVIAYLEGSPRNVVVGSARDRRK
ncbi:MAG: phosphoglycerate dehydrogenase [Planctomycetota bacterium]|nr:phosphoglycerate dehydrogenase [Planctomycetota bacterium]